MGKYASLADVKRVLRIEASTDTTVDARLRAALAAIEAWADRRTWKISLEGEQVEVFFDVREDAVLHLPSDDVTVTKLKVFEYPSSIGIPLSPVELGLGHGYDLTDTGDVLLRPVLNLSPFEGATAQRPVRTYSRVEVFFIGTGVVPRDFTEGIAWLAAGYYTDGPKVLSGLTSEKIGDYSYTRAPGGAADGVPEWLQQGLFFLKPLMKRSRVVVT